jgi:hypothetical protein
LFPRYPPSEVMTILVTVIYSSGHC